MVNTITAPLKKRTRKAAAKKTEILAYAPSVDATKRKRRPTVTDREWQRYRKFETEEIYRSICEKHGVSEVNQLPKSIKDQVEKDINDIRSSKNS